MQQHASSGNAIDYVRAGNSVSEEQLCRWAQHIYSAMDFLGSMAVSHRSIYPKHLMLNRTASGETVAKLSGFRDAVIYWNPDTNSVIPQACKTLLEACSFHAPEMFGSKVGNFGVRYFYFFGDTHIYPFICNKYCSTGQPRMAPSTLTRKLSVSFFNNIF